MNAYAAFQLAFMSLPFERMKQYISAPLSWEYCEAFAVANDPIRLLIRNAKNRNLERVKAAYAFIHLIFLMPDVKSKMKNYSSERNALASAERFLGFLSE